MLYIRNLYNNEYNGYTYAKMKGEIEKKLISNFDDGIVFYLAVVPMEDAGSEHLLMVVRRLVMSRLNGKADADFENFKLKLMEPGLLSRIDSYISENNLSSKSHLYKRYEIARLLSEKGCYKEGLYLFDLILSESAKTDIVWYFAMSGYVVVLQNRGLFAQAKEIADSLMDACNQLDENVISTEQKNSILYFSNKHYATLLRRLHFTDLSRKVRTSIIAHLEAAWRFCPSYYVCFSKGFFHYFIGEYENALTEYNNCLDMLEGHENEYYLIHLNCCLAEMGLQKNFEASHYTSRILPKLNKYKDSAESFPNFKNEINDFLVKLIEDFYNGNDPDQAILPDVRPGFEKLLGTNESLYCINNDLKRVTDYFRLKTSSRLHAYFKEEREDAERKFANFARVLDNSPTLAPRQGIALCVDIRGFTKMMDVGDNKRATDSLKILRTLLHTYVSSHFDDLNSTGDGYLFVKYTDKNTSIDDYTTMVLDIVSKLELVFNEIPKRAKVLCLDEGFKIGAGISCGELIRLRAEYNRSVSYYFLGDAANKATRVCDFARPQGIVIHYNSEHPLIDKDVIAKAITVKYANLKGKPGETYCVLLSQDVNELCHEYSHAFKYIFKSASPNEKRIFVNYGEPCKKGCMYCLNPNSKYETFKINDFDEELKKFSATDPSGEYLVSLGCENEALDANNKTATTELTIHLLDNTKYSIQISTKADAETIATFIDNLEVGLKVVSKDDIKTRLVFLYSLCTVEQSHVLEKNRFSDAGANSEERVNKIENDLQRLLSIAKRGYRFIPYVKPFLPGITDKDVKLRKMLSDFDTVVVGYPYFSRQIMYSLSSTLCNQPEGAKYYDYSKYFSDNDVLALTHPHSTGDKLFAFDYKKELMDYVASVEGVNDNIKIFLSSPCAVASCKGETCSTNVGDRSKEIASLLCRSRDAENSDRRKCPNSSCEHNSPK
ncbi:MAG: hypothetical protein HZA22_08595 [Nitrospirae bacterium]|nr:hypothetical protein [Nitrospirota bacterium]